MNETALKDLLDSECLRLQKDLHYTEKAHYIAAESCERLHFVLGIVGSSAGVVATATVVADQLVVAGGCALVSSVVTATITFVNPKSRAEQHLRTGRGLGAIKTRVRQIRSLDIRGGLRADLSEIRALLEQASNAKADLESRSLGTSERFFRKAKRKTPENQFSV